MFENVPRLQPDNLAQQVARFRYAILFDIDNGEIVERVNESWLSLTDSFALTAENRIRGSKKIIR